jgi:hypothetical protein
MGLRFSLFAARALQRGWLVRGGCKELRFFAPGKEDLAFCAERTCVREHKKTNLTQPGVKRRIPRAACSRHTPPVTQRKNEFCSRPPASREDFTTPFRRTGWNPA